jgi:hypothetical protein
VSRLLTSASCVLVASLAVSSLAETTPDVLQLILQNGDRIAFETIKSRTQTGGSKDVAVKVHWRGTLEVIDTTEEALVFAWMRDEPRLWKNQPIPAAMQDMADLASKARIELVVSRDGQVVDIRNFEEVMKLLDESAAVTRKLMIAAGRDEATVDRVLAAIKPLFGNREAATAMLSQDIAGYFLAYGWEVEPEGTIDSESQVPNPLGGEPIPSTFSLKVNDYGPTDGAIKAEWTDTIDSEGAKSMIRQIMRKLAPDKADDMDKEFDAADVFDIVRSGTFAYERERGVVTHATLTREAKVGTNVRRDTWEWIVDP